MSKYTELREQWPVFIYRGYEIEEEEGAVRIRYRFQIPGLSEFAPEWVFPKVEGAENHFQEDPVFRNMVFSLGMAELVSYWKICCPPRVEVEAGYLDQDQISWWKDLYFNGLGEFFYTNHIQEADQDTFMELVSTGHPADGETDQEQVQRRRELSGCLIPIGGGKDSAVTIELVKKTGLSSMAYIINPRGATTHCAQAGGYSPRKVIAASRTLDQNMLRLNREGYLNGHTPFSAIVAFSAVIAAYMHRLKYAALSNESSANESTVPGSTVNHQYSKSFRFEESFHQYEEKYLKSGVYYFSLLRPLSEFQIARYFARQKQYLSIFRSCNAGSKEDRWCGHCPKCLFVFLILSPFLSQEELSGIFGADMLNDPTLTGTLEQLVGIQEDKPFECVGSRGEMNTAIVMTIDRLEQEGKSLPVLLAYYKETALYRQYEESRPSYFTYYDEENLLPGIFDQVLRTECLAGEPGRMTC